LSGGGDGKTYRSEFNKIKGEKSVDDICVCVKYWVSYYENCKTAATPPPRKKHANKDNIFLVIKKEEVYSAVFSGP